MESVWTRKPRRQRPPGLDREQIVREAVALLDAEGLDALSMRRLGARLNAGATSLYWYVSTKDDLLDLVVDEVYGEIVAGLPETTAGWRELGSALAYSMRASVIRHLWVMPLIGTRPAVGPSAIAVVSRLYNAFAAAGFGRDADFAVSALVAYVLGALSGEAAWQAMTARAGGDSRKIYGMIRPALSETAAAHPELLERFDELHREDPATLRAAAFDFGLCCVLDGLAARIPAPEPVTPDR